MIGKQFLRVEVCAAIRGDTPASQVGGYEEDSVGVIDTVVDGTGVARVVGVGLLADAVPEG